jgi:putative hemolysin
VGVITGIILIFGEILPKIYANRNPFGFSKLMASPLKILDRSLLFILTVPMSRLSGFLESKLGRANNEFSVNELSKALEVTTNSETTKEEQKILEGIVNFGNTEVTQIMCPRVDMFALSDTLSMQEVLPKIIENGYSRIPVYKEKLDHIVGVIYTKDLLAHINTADFAWQSLMRKPFYVPENKKLDDLLEEFQQKKIHLAIVVDEYGGTSGLISLEDIIEEIVGDISDEFDDDALFYSKLDDKNYVFDGKISLKDFLKIIPVNDLDTFEKIKGESETLAGFLLELSQTLPRKGQKLTFETWTFTIEAVDQKRIKRVKLTL